MSGVHQTSLSFQHRFAIETNIFKGCLQTVVGKFVQRAVDAFFPHVLVIVFKYGTTFQSRNECHKIDGVFLHPGGNSLHAKHGRIFHVLQQLLHQPFCFRLLRGIAGLSAGTQIFKQSLHREMIREHGGETL